MKKIIPLKKQLTFKTNVNEITSISLENTLHNIENDIEGELIINGAYKITETSTQVDEFEFKIPINIEIDKKYIIDNIKIDIDDFYYEVINNNTLEVNIEVSLDNIEENKFKEENIIQEKIENIETKEERCIEEEKQEDEKENKQIKEEYDIKKNNEEKKEETYIKNIFENMQEEQEEYSTYHIYIVREEDTEETIQAKYNITKEMLYEYNEKKELKKGDKLIIPEKNVRK